MAAADIFAQLQHQLLNLEVISFAPHTAEELGYATRTDADEVVAAVLGSDIWTTQTAPYIPVEPGKKWANLKATSKEIPSDFMIAGFWDPTTHDSGDTELGTDFNSFSPPDNIVLLPVDDNTWREVARGLTDSKVTTELSGYYTLRQNFLDELKGRMTGFGEHPPQGMANLAQFLETGNAWTYPGPVGGSAREAKMSVADLEKHKRAPVHFAWVPWHPTGTPLADLEVDIQQHTFHFHPAGEITVSKQPKKGLAGGKKANTTEATLFVLKRLAQGIARKPRKHPLTTADKVKADKDKADKDKAAKAAADKKLVEEKAAADTKLAEEKAVAAKKVKDDAEKLAQDAQTALDDAKKLAEDAKLAAEAKKTTQDPKKTDTGGGGWGGWGGGWGGLGGGWSGAGGGWSGAGGPSVAFTLEPETAHYMKRMDNRRDFVASQVSGTMRSDPTRKANKPKPTIKELGADEPITLEVFHAYAGIQLQEARDTGVIPGQYLGKKNSGAIIPDAIATKKIQGFLRTALTAIMEKKSAEIVEEPEVPLFAVLPDLSKRFERLLLINRELVGDTRTVATVLETALADDAYGDPITTELTLINAEVPKYRGVVTTAMQGVLLLDELLNAIDEGLVALQEWYTAWGLTREPFDPNDALIEIGGYLDAITRNEAFSKEFKSAYVAEKVPTKFLFAFTVPPAKAWNNHAPLVAAICGYIASMTYGFKKSWIAILDEGERTAKRSPTPVGALGSIPLHMCAQALLKAHDIHNASPHLVMGTKSVLAALANHGADQGALHSTLAHVYPAALPLSCGREFALASTSYFHASPTGRHIHTQLNKMNFPEPDYEWLSLGHHSRGLVAAILYASAVYASASHKGMLSSDDCEALDLRALLEHGCNDVQHARIVSDADIPLLYTLASDLASLAKLTNYDEPEEGGEDTAGAASAGGQIDARLSADFANPSMYPCALVKALVLVMDCQAILVADVTTAEQFAADYIKNLPPRQSTRAGLFPINLRVGLSMTGAECHPSESILRKLQEFGHLPPPQGISYLSLKTLASSLNLNLGNNNPSQWAALVETRKFCPITVSPRIIPVGVDVAGGKMFAHVVDSLIKDAMGDCYDLSALAVLVRESVYANTVLIVLRDEKGMAAIVEGPCCVTGQSGSCIEIRFASLCVDMPESSASAAPRSRVTSVSVCVDVSVCPLLLGLYGLKMRLMASNPAKFGPRGVNAHGWTSGTDAAQSGAQDSAMPYMLTLAAMFDLEMSMYM